MCTRQTVDPLIRAFLDRYGLNLLAIPRQFVNCGDVYIGQGSQLSTSVGLADLLTPPPQLPAPVTGEQLADLSVVVSNGVSLSAGLNVLANMLTALGAGDLFKGVKAGYQSSASAKLRFRVREATRDHVDPSALGRALSGCTIDEAHPLVSDDNTYFVVSGVVRTHTVSITAEDAMGHTVDIAADALQAAGGHAGVAINRGSNGEITYRGTQRLAIGVELYELVHDREKHLLKMRLPAKRPRSLRSAAGAPPRELEPAFIGGLDGDIFITAPDAPITPSA